MREGEEPGGSLKFEILFFEFAVNVKFPLVKVCLFPRLKEGLGLCGGLKMVKELTVNLVRSRERIGKKRGGRANFYCIFLLLINTQKAQSYPPYKMVFSVIQK